MSQDTPAYGNRVKISIRGNSSIIEDGNGGIVFFCQNSMIYHKHC
jgi:hypothetical protein